MGDDRSRGAADTRLVDLGEAIKSALGGRTRQSLADEIGIDPSAVTRMIAGQMKEVTLERVVQIEDALGLTRGALLRAAGYVDEIVTPEDALDADIALSPEFREVIKTTIGAARRAS